MLRFLKYMVADIIDDPLFPLALLNLVLINAITILACEDYSIADALLCISITLTVSAIAVYIEWKKARRR